MSAFLVDTKTMDKVVNLIDALSPRGRKLGTLAVPNLSAANDDDRDAALQRVGEALYVLNGQALRQRYGNSEGNTLPSYRHHPALISGHKTMIAHYKALRCLLYQCAEGDVPSSPIYKALEAVACEAAECIVHELPEFKHAAWD